MMEPYGPLFHRNGAHILPSWVARLALGFVIVVGAVEFVLGILSVIH